jgi:hypothetical protein
MIRYVPKSFFGITSQGEDEQRQHAARLLLTGWDVEAAATMTGLPLDQVREIAENAGDDFGISQP